MVVRPQMRNPTKISKEHGPHHLPSPPAADGAVSVWEELRIRLDIACLCGAEASLVFPRLRNTTPTSCTLDSIPGQTF